MSTSAPDPRKRIPKTLGVETQLFGTYTLSDLGVAVVPGVLVVLVVQLVFPAGTSVLGYTLETFLIPLAAGAILLGAVFVYLTPSYTTSLDWILALVGYRGRQRDLDHEAAKAVMHVDRAHLEEGVIERVDGAYLGVVQVEARSMALATRAEWAGTAEAFQEFCNTVLEFDVQFYSTPTPFPVAAYLGHFEARLGDPDVKANPRLAALIEHYLEWYAGDLAQRQMTIRDNYVIVPVRPDEVQFGRGSLVRNLVGIPLLGLLVRIWSTPHRLDEHAAMLELLDERLWRVEAGLRDIDGCAAHRVGADEALALLGRFWNGEDWDEGDLDGKLRGGPMVGS